MPPPRTVTSTQLTLLMTTLIVVPILTGIALYWNAPRVAEPELPIQIKIGSVWLDGPSKEEQAGAEGTESVEDPSAEQGASSRRLVQCIQLRNISEVQFGKLSIGINDQFFSTGNKSLDPGQEVSIPLESFIARNGSVRFPVGSRPIHKATVFAQLGAGARGISEFQFEEDEQSGPTEWKSPSPNSKARAD